MRSRSATRLVLLIALTSLLAAPSAFAVIWGPVGVPPLGTTRNVDFFSCATGSPAYTGYEEWDCLRHLHQVPSPSTRAMVTDTNCTTSEEESVTYWCKGASNGIWYQITWSELESCETCPGD
jgi:hypothetical protein